MHRHLQALAVFAFALLGLACQREPSAQELAEGPDPIAALVSPIASNRYALPYWVREEHGRTRLWFAARKACSGKPESLFPNCGSIRVASYWGLPPTVELPPVVEAHRPYPVANPDARP